MEYSQDLTLDIRDNYSYDELYAKQFDKGYPIVFHIVQNKIPFDLTGVQASFQLKKPDGNIVLVDGDVSGNTVTIMLDEQMTACFGRIKFQIVLADGDDQQITTINGIMKVDPSVILNGTESESEIGIIQKAIDAVPIATAAADRATAAASSAEASSTSAATSASQAATTAASVTGYVDDARRYASNAEASATNASSSASSASSSASNASNSASSASTSASQASASASSAQQYATNAQGYANTASGYADSAGASATQASGYVDTVVAAASRAATSETNAQTYASNASDSADDAQTYAGNASTSASNASISELNASASASSARSSSESASASATSAATSATSAETHESNALQYSKYSQSYAVGTGGARQGEATDNALYYYELARDIAHGIEGAMMPMGSIPFASLATADKQPGYVYCITDAFTTDNTFEVGAGIDVSADTSIYCQVNMKWAIMGSDNSTSIPLSDIRSLFNH